MYYDEIRIVIEVVSALMCFVLVWFMAKPYNLTRERRYLGLPLGFCFLGISYAVSAAAFTVPNFYISELAWLQLLPRTFAFLFLAVTYYFSKKPSKNSPLIWDLTISSLIFVLVTAIIYVIFFPQLGSTSYLSSSVFFRAFNLICLFYICIHTLSTHVKKPEPTTVVIPFGFILLGMNQYSIMIFALDRSYFAFWGALVLRLAALVIFLAVSYQTFRTSEERGPK
jgi:hypothetical protein